MNVSVLQTGNNIITNLFEFKKTNFVFLFLKLE